MKTTSIVQAAAFVLILATMLSCRSGREYDRGYGHNPPPRTSVSLILHGGPGLAINRYRDGRYYYRAPNGYIYWRGHNNQYYLDRKYMSRSYSRHQQYNDWRRYHGRRR